MRDIQSNSIRLVLMSKRIWNHPDERPNGRRYWRSLGEFGDTPEFREWLHREFPQGAALMKDEEDAGNSRRDFMKLIGATASLAGFGMSGCRRPETRIRPYARNVEWVIPGKALYYASAMPRLGGCTPLVVTTFEGRPTHLQGNGLHPESNGSVDVFAQASILDLYDPDRSKDFRHNNHVITRDRFLRFLDKQKRRIADVRGKGLALLFDEVPSPTRSMMVKKVLAKFPEARVFRYEAINHDKVRRATETVFGRGVVQVPHFSVCEKILSLDCDFLGLDRPKAGSVSRFMSGRRAAKPGDPMNRLYVLEGRYTVTGGMADHRLRVPATQIGKVAVALAKEIAGATNDAALASAADAAKLSGTFSPRDDFPAWVREAAKDLVASRNGKAMILVGPQQPIEVQVLVAAINRALGAFTKAPDKGKPPIELLQAPPDESGSLADLAAAAKNKEVFTLAIVGAADPMFDAPADLDWPAAQAAIESVIHVGFRDRTPTARAAQWHVPGTHFLEQWGDVRSMSGVYSVVQPMILPLFGGVSDLEFLSWLVTDDPLLKEEKPAAPTLPVNGAVPEDPKDPMYLAVRETFNALAAGKDIETAWSQTLRDGFLPGSEWPAVEASTGGISANSLATFQDVEPPSLEKIEVTFVPDQKSGMGATSTTAGCRNARTRSRKSRGTTPPSSASGRPLRSS